VASEWRTAARGSVRELADEQIRSCDAVDRGCSTAGVGSVFASLNEGLHGKVGEPVPAARSTASSSVPTPVPTSSQGRAASFSHSNIFVIVYRV